MGLTLRTVWFEHRLVLLSIYCYLMLVWGLLALHGLANATPPAAQFRAGLVQLVGLTGLALCIRAFADRRTKVWFSSSKLIGAVVVALLSPAVVGIYSAWKQALALLVTYSWDVPLHHLSLRLFGAPEWTFFAWFYRHPLAIHSLDRFYFVAWGVATLATMLALAWTERRVLRMQALLATALSWALLGSVGAALFASGGPVFYHLFVGGADPVRAPAAGAAAVSRPALRPDPGLSHTFVPVAQLERAGGHFGDAQHACRTGMLDRTGRASIRLETAPRCGLGLRVVALPRLDRARLALCG